MASIDDLREENFINHLTPDWPLTESRDPLLWRSHALFRCRRWLARKSLQQLLPGMLLLYNVSHQRKGYA